MILGIVEERDVCILCARQLAGAGIPAGLNLRVTATGKWTGVPRGGSRA